MLRAAAMCLFFAVAPCLLAQEIPSATALVISVADQKLALLRDGGLVKKFPISTSKFGLGDSFGSYKTPVGKFRVCAKVGDHLSIGAVFKQRNATGEVLPVNAPGRDPIVTRIIWLDGLEPQNANARSRGIYIHGTTEEKRIGDPVSYGCIRMRSKDVVEVYEELPLEASVTIIEEKLPRFPKYSPQKPQIIAAAPSAKAPTKSSDSNPTPNPAPSASPAPNLALGLQNAAPKLSSTVKVDPPLNTSASLAMQGSILDAGLPAGPTIPSLPAAPEPKDVTRFSPMTPGLSAESPFSLQGISRDLSPAIRAADVEAAKREATVQTQPAVKPKSTKPAPDIAFRRGAARE
jgi:hypothetical protein